MDFIRTFPIAVIVLTMATNVAITHGNPLPAPVAEPSTFLSAPCSSAQDCYLIPDILELACYYNVGLCNCQTTISSIHRVESVNGACLMSKYGPCATRTTNASTGRSGLEVGCQHGYTCIENQCRDPNASTEATIKYETPFIFDRQCKDIGDCEFSDGLRFICNDGVGKCQCEQIEIADKPSPVWDLRNYDGAHNCSVGRFGSCGQRDGIQVTCHGHGVECVDGRCMDRGQTVASVGDACELSSDCEPGLLCSSATGWSCIKPGSIGKGGACSGDGECEDELKCKMSGWTSNCS